MARDDRPPLDDAETPRATYDRIAEHFSSTREYPWPEVESFLDDYAAAASEAASADAGGPARGLDVGCGNGRHAEAMADHVPRVVGLDASRGLLEQARERSAERGFDAALVQGDASSLPLCDDSVAVAVYVATLHHLRPRTARVASLSELARVLAPGGRALVSAWSVEHDRFDADEGFDTTVDWTLPGGERVPRYYHIYDTDEFAADLEASALSVVESFVSSGNCYAVVGPADETAAGDAS
ncbi:Methyltransferase domain-containing protein [Halogeometricum rufum]|jgi:ubiquinone/menaquinone biosynthesis C-methylase UbiE|uniref:Methyltransferase domain-containing protein n=1 Tax=Halogeometricum rufum TaxID=553469 RepID=A0A1I6GLN2_9EURY|nr:class I SAM-dependent methyltransferase [Halogeometricum rufum]SFR43094.1 Methyltransferase domain-containing protein [Halogeometricum rufum]